ncbi:hypothetical protein SG34_001865 [Thalassomonas viridans]|uniref:DUF6817 domain-containing protein n=1 Tax=Thalassomonas viridans TaxID=137584 RepID=A0AAE9Z2Q2_9GAMM|nr:hypothetical protein [Thalassomonas viridans]WDE05706.1 hypothetical protein SG34_001865 [Thalassomonas viridans]
MEIRKSNLDERVKQLQSLGSEEFAHINGPLTAHLVGTYKILERWQLDESLCLAGLFHAIYGSDPTRAQLLGTDQRAEVAAMIGEKAEELVYLFCSCDKPFVLPQIGAETKVSFRNRFTGETSEFPAHLLNDFCELTIANDLDVARNKSEEYYHDDILAMFKRMYPMVSSHTQAELDLLFVKFCA